MKRVISSLCGVAAVLGLAGCGGSGGAPSAPANSVPSRIEILARAPRANRGPGFSQLTGFVAGKPAFLSYVDATRWSLQVVGEAAVELPTGAFPNAEIRAFDDGIIVGRCDSGTFVYQQTPAGWSATRFDGLSEVVLDSASKELIGRKGGQLVRVDIATKTERQVTLPAAAVPQLARAGFLVYTIDGVRDTFRVRNLKTNAEWGARAAPGDTQAFPYSVNARGAVTGSSGNGQTGRAMVWASHTGSGEVLASYPGGTVEPGWISPDGSRVVVNVYTGRFQSYFFVNGRSHPVAALEGGTSVPYLYGLNDSGAIGFGYTDPSLDPPSLVAVRITY